MVGIGAKRAGLGELEAILGANNHVTSVDVTESLI
jgi:hypothetical protein